MEQRTRFLVATEAFIGILSTRILESILQAEPGTYFLTIGAKELDEERIDPGRNGVLIASDADRLHGSQWGWERHVQCDGRDADCNPSPVMYSSQ